MKTIKIKDFEIRNNLPFILIAGPCQMESRDHAIETANEIKEIASSLKLNVIYKTSFDKANRTSVSGKRGFGFDKALPVFEEIQKFMPVTTDVHTEEQCAEVAKCVDMLQIPALLSRQTDLLLAAAKTNKPINIKKGQFMAPWDISKAAEKIASAGNNQIMLTDRGTSFGYNRLINDMRGLQIMADTGYPVCFDATHSVQEPVSLGESSGGQREFVKILARAASAVGIAALFVESHPDPDKAPSDGPCMIKLSELKNLVAEIQEFDYLAKKFNSK